MSVAVLAALMGVVSLAADETDIAAFREARFGMFIHWGLYSQLGGRWKGVTMPHIGEWVQSYFRIPNDEYALLAKNFNPTKFDPDEWARQAKAAGMEYVILTTKHHDGFSMFATKVSPYNVVDATPFGRDVFGELASACRRQGLKVGLYYSQALDWHEFDAADPGGEDPKRRSSLANAGGMPWGNSWDWPDASKKDLSRYLKTKVYPQLRELLTNYGEIFVIWFDTPFCLTCEMSRDLREFVRKYQPHVLVNSRIGNGCGDFGSLGDNQMAAGKSEFPLESPVTLNDTWGFKFDDHNWKSGYRVACALVKNISCNANFLLNIGPRPDGLFPDASSDVLAELAQWRKTSGFEIRGAKASPFAQPFPWGWCTLSGDRTLQFVVKNEWTNDVEVCGIRNDVRACTVPFRKTGDVLLVKVEPQTGFMPRVVRVELAGEPDVDRRLMTQGGVLDLTPDVAERIVQGNEVDERILSVRTNLVGRVCRVTQHGSFTDWHHRGDEIGWRAYFPQKGRFQVRLRTESWAHSRPWSGDRTVEIALGGQRLVARLEKDIELEHTVYDRAESVLGDLDVPSAGEYEISVKTLSAGVDSVFHDLTLLRLIRN